MWKIATKNWKKEPILEMVPLKSDGAHFLKKKLFALDELQKAVFFTVFLLFLFSAWVLRKLLNRYGFETSFIIFSTVFSIGINCCFRNCFQFEATIIFLKKVLGKKCVWLTFPHVQIFTWWCFCKTTQYCLVYIYLVCLVCLV